MTMAALILLVLKTSIVLSVFAIGLEATFSDATYLLRHPAHLGRALLSMYLLMPLVALMLALTFDLDPAVKIALVTLSVSPIPPILPNKAFKAGGKQQYVLGLLVAIAVLAIVFIPIAMEVIERIARVPLQMRATAVAGMVLTTILAPLLIGIAVRAFAPSVAQRVAKPLAALASVLLILAFLPAVLAMARTFLSLIGNGTLLSFAVFAVIGFIAGHLLGGPESENRRVLALATASRHPAVAIGIANASFPEQQRLAAAAVLLYLILSAILSGGYLKWAKRSQPGTAIERKATA
jgi:BASS family bile acid:Na+ symporter